jgi:hypothetical protein
VTTEAQCKRWYGRLWKENGCWGCSKTSKRSQSTVKTNTSTRLSTLSQMGPRSCCLSGTSIVVQGSGLTRRPGLLPPLYGIDPPEQDLGSVNMLEAPSIQHSDDSAFDESQPIELFQKSRYQLSIMNEGLIHCTGMECE